MLDEYNKICYILKEEGGSFLAASFYRRAFFCRPGIFLQTGIFLKMGIFLQT